MKISGIIPPVVTPMKANEDIDLPRLKQHIDWQISKGVHGIFVLGTTGECCSMDEREKQEIIATAVAHVNKRTELVRFGIYALLSANPFKKFWKDCPTTRYTAVSPGSERTGRTGRDTVSFRCHCGHLMIPRDPSALSRPFRRESSR